MARWSLKKLFLKVSHEDFINAVAEVQQGLEDPQDTVALDVAFFKGLPNATTSYEPLVDEMNTKDKDAKIFHRVSRLSDITKELWASAVYVEANLRSEKSYACIEAKGFLPSTLTFYVQSTPDAEKKAETAAKEKFPLCLRGDGFFSYHYPVTYG